MVDMLDANNFYRMTTATSIINSGTGSNSLTKPAGSEVASIAPGKKYSVYIPSQASFTTDFSAESTGYSIFMYAKPEPGVVMTVGGNTVFYENQSYTITNDVGDKVSIPMRSNSARFIVVTVSDLEIGLYVDGKWGAIDANTTDQTTNLTVTLLASGGIIDDVGAMRGAMSARTIVEITREYLKELTEPADTMKMFDTERDGVVVRKIPYVISAHAGELGSISIDANDCLAFRVEYTLTGEGFVMINGVQAASGTAFDGEPEDMIVSSPTECTVSDIVVTEYHSSNMGALSIATIDTDSPSGAPAPTHAHDDSACNRGSTKVTMTASAGGMAGWFYASNGSPMPGVTMNNGVLSGSGLYVNGKPYVAGTVVRDWYFLTRVASFTGTFTSNVPMHSITVIPSTPTAAQIDDLYESFFGNPTISVSDESIEFAEEPVFVISTEWNIVSSG